MTKMTQEITERLLLASVKQGMDQSVVNLNWQAQAKLTRLRLQALEQKSQLSAGFGFSSFSRGFAVATAVTLAVSLWVLPDVTDSRLEMTAEADMDVNAIEVLMSHEDMDLLENLDMYEWLEAEYG